MTLLEEMVAVAKQKLAREKKHIQALRDEGKEAEAKFWENSPEHKRLINLAGGKTP